MTLLNMILSWLVASVLLLSYVELRLRHQQRRGHAGAKTLRRLRNGRVRFRLCDLVGSQPPLPAGRHPRESHQSERTTPGGTWS